MASSMRRPLDEGSRIRRTLDEGSRIRLVDGGGVLQPEALPSDPEVVQQRVIEFVQWYSGAEGPSAARREAACARLVRHLASLGSATRRAAEKATAKRECCPWCYSRPSLPYCWSFQARGVAAHACPPACACVPVLCPCSPVSAHPASCLPGAKRTKQRAERLSRSSAAVAKAVCEAAERQRQWLVRGGRAVGRRVAAMQDGRCARLAHGEREWVQCSGTIIKLLGMLCLLEHLT